MNSFKIAVVGLGAIGSAVSSLLGQLHPKQILLIDHDHFEQRNRNVSTLYAVSAEELRSSVSLKAEILTRVCSAAFPQTEWECYAREIADVPLVCLKDCDLILSCTDNALARAETSFLARALGIPMLDAGLSGGNHHTGRISYFPARKEAACYLCQLSERRRAELLSLSLTKSLSCQSMPPDVPMNSTPAMTSIVAGLMVHEASRRLAGETGLERDAYAWRVSLSSSNTSIEKIDISRQMDCPWHDSDSYQTRQLLAPDTPFRSLLRSRNSWIQLDWPICTLARCHACRYRYAPRVRLARLRRRELCPKCHAASPEPLEIIEEIVSGSSTAELTPRDIGFEEEQSLMVKSYPLHLRT